MRIVDDRETEIILVCPYCGDEKSGRELGCCGESRTHFEEREVYCDTQEEVNEA